MIDQFFTTVTSPYDFTTLFQIPISFYLLFLCVNDRYVRLDSRSRLVSSEVFKFGFRVINNKGEFSAESCDQRYKYHVSYNIQV